MHNKTIYFVDENQEYLEAIGKYLVNNYKELNVTLISDAAKMKEMLKNNKEKIDILLINEKMYDEDLKKPYIHKIVMLSEVEKNVKPGASKIEKYLTIYKYQSGEKLLAEIIDLFEENSSRRKFEKTANNTQIIGIYSPVGGVGKTTIAVMLSILAAYQEKRVMYLNLEHVASTQYYFKSQNEENLSKMIYYLRNKKSAVQEKIAKTQQLDSKYNVYFFSPPDNGDDLLTMTIDEYSLLLEATCKMGKYDYVFVDFSTEISERKKDMLNLCDKILLIMAGEGSAIEKIRIYREEIESSQIASSLMEKTSIVLNKYSRDYGLNIDSIKIDGRKIEYRLPNDDNLNLHSESGFFIDVNNPMQKQVIEMLQNI
ncbi:MAG: AAA family ATPase [Alkaliphilus sp.]